MKYVTMLAVLFVFSLYAGPPANFQSRPSFNNGSNYYHGGRYLGNSRGNVFGGQNYYNSRGRFFMNSRPNIHGGYNYRIHGGW